MTGVLSDSPNINKAEKGISDHFSLIMFRDCTILTEEGCCFDASHSSHWQRFVETSVVVQHPINAISHENGPDFTLFLFKF